MVRVDQIIDLLAVSHAPDCIAAYRDAMAAGARFPPIAVLRWGARYLVADGHKRFSAYRALSAAPLPVEIWPLRRWLRDQWQQFQRKTRQQRRLLRGGARDAANRRAAHRLFWDTIGHWQRIGRSLGHVLRESTRGTLPLRLPLSSRLFPRRRDAGERKRARARKHEGERAR